MKPIEIQTSKTGSTAAEQTTSIMPSRLAASAGALAPTLASTEQKQLEDCEAIIAAGWDNFVRVGQALAIIRNNELYRQSFKTFEEYCVKKWHYTRTHANRLIGAAETMRILAPIGAIAASTNDLAPIGAMPVPTNEAQLRPLMGLQPQDVKTAWNNAVNAAGSGRVTAKLVQAAAQPFRSADSRQPIAKQRNRTLKLGSKHVDELIILLKSARSFVNEAGEALRSRTSPGEIQWLHEQARRRLDQTLALVESKAKT